MIFPDSACYPAGILIQRWHVRSATWTVSPVDCRTAGSRVSWVIDGSFHVITNSGGRRANSTVHENAEIPLDGCLGLRSLTRSVMCSVNLARTRRCRMKRSLSQAAVAGSLGGGRRLWPVELAQHLNGKREAYFFVCHTGSTT